MTQPSEIVIPEKHQALLAAHNYGLLSTLRKKDGLISTNPVSYVWDAEQACVLISTIKSRIKYKNLLANPLVSFCVVDAQDHTKYVELRGEASLEEDADRSFLRRQFRETSGGEEAPDDLDPPGEARVIIRIHPHQSSSPLLYGGRFSRE
ncbi:MAG: pyridoxamine 5'-phosphate oxidase family protein [Myxococcota bacterium]